MLVGLSATLMLVDFLFFSFHLFFCSYEGDCFYCNYVVRSFCNTYAGEDFCSVYVGEIMQVGVSIAIM